jgi:hypothetical protein
MCGSHFAPKGDGTKVPAPENEASLLIAFAGMIAFSALMALAIMVLTWPGLFPWSPH